MEDNSIKNLKKILVTGGTGYIGTHTTVTLMQAGLEVIILDNLSNSSSLVLKRIAQLTGREPCFVKGDVLDSELLDTLFLQYKVDAVIHFAGLKAVNRSIIDPLNYYTNNVSGTIALCQSMKKAKIFKLIFSSSATVYGDQNKIPISEDQPSGHTANPYGRSKLIAEQILNDLVKSDPRWSISVLRYFNPIGAHESGIIGEDTKEIPDNLMPYLMKVALGKLTNLSIYGNDYATIDGTGVRDYIHVVDLARGHLATLNAFKNFTGLNIWNLGTGRGYSVLQIIHTFEKVSGCKIPYKIVKRRLGDIGICFADPNKAFFDLNWNAKYNLRKMIKDGWRWHKMNPDGYATSKSDKNLS